MERRIKIDGEMRVIKEVFAGGYLPLLEMDDGSEWYVASSSEHAGEQAVMYWEDMAESDPEEFSCIIGEKRLVLWATNRMDDFGIHNFDEFLEVVATAPEEEFASYDGNECAVERVGTICRELGFIPTVAYLHNC